MSATQMHKCRLCEQVCFTRTQLNKHVVEKHGSLLIDVEASQKVDKAEQTFKISPSLWEKGAEKATTSDTNRTQVNNRLEQAVAINKSNDVFEKKNSSGKFRSSHVTFVLKNLEHLWPPGYIGHGLSRHSAQHVGKNWFTKVCSIMKGKNYRSSKHAKVDFMTLLNKAFHDDPFLSRPTLKKLQQDTGLSRLGITLWFKWSREKLQYTSPKQIMISTFNQNQYPGPELIAKLKKSTGLRKSKIESWFRVSRALSNIFDPKLADKEEMVLWRMFKRKIKGISDEDVDLMAELIQMERLHVYKIFLTWCQRYEVNNYMTPIMESSHELHQSNNHLSSIPFESYCTENVFTQGKMNNESVSDSGTRTPITPTQLYTSFSSTSEDGFEVNKNQEQLSINSKLEITKHKSRPTFMRAFESILYHSKSSYSKEPLVCSPTIDREDKEPASSSAMIEKEDNDSQLTEGEEDSFLPGQEQEDGYFPGYLPEEKDDDGYLPEEEDDDLDQDGGGNLPKEKEEIDYNSPEKKGEDVNMLSREDGSDWAKEKNADGNLFEEDDNLCTEEGSGNLPEKEEGSGNLCTEEVNCGNVPAEADRGDLPEEENTRKLPTFDYNRYPLVIVEKIEDITDNSMPPTTRFPTTSDGHVKRQTTTPTTAQTFVKALTDVFEANLDSQTKQNTRGLFDQLSDHQLVLNVLKKLRRKQRKRGIPCRVKVANLEKGELYTASYRRRTRDLKRIKNHYFPSYRPSRRDHIKEDSDVEYVDVDICNLTGTSKDPVAAVLEVLYKHQQKQRYLHVTKPWQRGITKPVGSPTDAEKALYNAIQDHSTSSEKPITHDPISYHGEDSSAEDDDCLYIAEASDHEMSSDYKEQQVFES